MWQSVRSITKYNQSSSNPTSTAPSLPEQLDTFFTQFEDSFSSNRGLDPDANFTSPGSNQPLTLQTYQVKRALHINCIKPNGPDGIAGHVLAIAEQVDAVFTGIFNLSPQ